MNTAIIKLITHPAPDHDVHENLLGREEAFEADLDVFYHKHWIVAGVTADIPEPGDVFALDIGPSSIILVRDDNADVRAFRNVCRHRGARLKDSGKSTVGMLVCPYHQWTYDLEGNLRHAAHMGKNFDATCRSLIPVNVKVIGTHIMVCLSDNAPQDIDELETHMIPRFAPYNLTYTKIAHETEMVADVNWKLLIEKNRGRFNFEPAHPGGKASVPSSQFGVIDGCHGSDVTAAERWEGEGFICEAIDRLDENTVTQFRFQRLPLANSGKSQVQDPRVACARLFADLTRRDLGAVQFWTHNSWTHVMSDRAVVTYIIPLESDKTLVRTKWLVHADAAVGVDYDLETLTAGWDGESLQNTDLTASVNEIYVDQFSRWYAARLAANGVGMGVDVDAMPGLEIVSPGQSLRFNDSETWASFGALWNSGEQKTLECCAVHDETHDVRTFVFRCQDFTALAFEPGQFITISPQIAGQTVSRCYTVSSAPTRPFTFSITVKRVPGGTVSNWLHDNMKAGVQLSAAGPAGAFTPIGHPCRKLLYLSAGSGVTPLMSMARAGFDLRADLDTVFVHSARTPTDIVFRGELVQLEAMQKKFKVFAVCEGYGSEPDWDGPIGRLDLSLLQSLVPDFLEREVFTCGPKGYMDAVQRVLQEGGFDLRHYHQESFDIAALDPEVEVEVSAVNSGEVFTITLAKTGKVFTMDSTQTVLAAAKAAGAVVPSSCSQGICGTCKTAVLEGTVEMKHQGGIRQREIDKGLRLLCCSKPTSDLVIDL